MNQEQKEVRPAWMNQFLDESHAEFPSLDDGPPKRSWAPAMLACLGDARVSLAPSQRPVVWFSVLTGDGVTHRFLLTRKNALALSHGLASALSDFKLDSIQI